MVATGVVAMSVVIMVRHGCGNHGCGRMSMVRHGRMSMVIMVRHGCGRMSMVVMARHELID